MDISFIIINYRSRQFLDRCFASINRHASFLSYEIIVINNDDVVLEKLPSLPNLHIFEHGINKGFAQACNMGAKRASGKILFFLNSDTELLTTNINELVAIFKNSNIGAAAPRLLVPDGSPQAWSSGYEITVWDIIKNNLGQIKSSKLWSSDDVSEVDWASGAALAVPRKTFIDCGMFDEKFFMYFEDVDLCKRIRGLNKKIIILPEIHVLHIGGQSKSNTKEQKKQYYQSQDYYFKKHFGMFSSKIIRFLRIFAMLFIKGRE